MKFRIIVLVVLIPLAAMATSPEESYVAARDAAIKTFEQRDKAGPFDDQAFEDHKKALDGLARMIAPVIGASEIKGFPGPARLNVRSLVPGDIDFEALDGLVYSSVNDKAQVLVTTDGLLDRWLRAHRSDWETVKRAGQGARQGAGQALATALKTESFYTKAISSDAAVFRYADIPIAKSAKAGFAVAMLAARSQDLGPQIPDEIVIAAGQGGRFYLVTAPVTAKITEIPACDAIKRDFEKRSNDAFAAYSASQLQDRGASDRSMRLRDEGNDAYRRCFVQRAPRERFFAAVTAQAQALADSLPGR
jgi:hypothetical protein